MTSALSFYFFSSNFVTPAKIMINGKYNGRKQKRKIHEKKKMRT
jgi:hypothetical protein